jgi:hypothetical protein
VSNHIVHKYDDIPSFLTAVQSRRDPAGASGQNHGGFHFHESLEQALQMCRQGWHTERPKVDAILNPLRARLADRIDIVPERMHDLVGYEPDIDRYLDGEMECMWEDTMVEAPRMGKVYTLLLSGSVSAHVDTDTVIKRGVAIIGLVEAFQMCGAELEIWVENSCTSGTGGQWSSLVRVCRAGENVDIDTLMFPLGNPDWQRRFSFAVREGESDAIRRQFGFTPSGGYGSTADLLCTQIVGPSFTLSKGGTATATSTTLLDSDPVAWILSTLEAQGVYEPAA